MMDESLIFDYLLQYISPEISNILFKISKDEKRKIEEIRLRNNSPLMVCYGGGDYYVSRNGKLIENEKYNFMVSKKHLFKTFQLVSNYSIYAFEEEIRNGFITLKGGHRVGIAGKIIYGPNGIETIKDISSLNIRIAREKIGVSDEIMKYLIKESNSIYHTLIVSPPQCGKTTLLRDIIRNISNGMPGVNFKGRKVGVVDERSEIAGVYNGIPQKNIGERTDVLDGCLKKDGIIMLIRAMSPEIIATDELGGKEDIKAIYEALKAGVILISTVHGKDLEDIMTKNNLGELIEGKIFERIIILDNSKGVGTIRDILDGHTFISVIN
ncbi:stage III sporulation protein AA [Anaerosalibacter massiliensis]|uniref:Stage III sporulation protein AA n=1 Tax=Anaerosalibacter massiliensis TaxID=1347392 RepID=A0A9X2MGT1_9FIRM|nr:stage III sporulation protein AA [Anaerosalibacter massiliensis]MCR2042805.1 stage III sporulation protein AA [Anaerosalibacter massiliensis]